MKTVTNFAILLCAGFWFGAGIGMVQAGGLPHVHISIEWNV
jgi:hypothetical protein